MRSLVLLRGAPGSGKSTFIKENGLSNWTISADEIRMMFQSPVTRIDGGKEISQKNDNKVWDFIYTITEERMKRGEFVIIDATHSRSQWLTRYKELSSKYRYRVYCVEFMPDLDVVLKQNKSRDSLKYVPEEYIKKSYEFIKLDKLQGWISMLSKQELLDMTKGELPMVDYSHYKKIHHVGDIHGCYDPLKKYYDIAGGVHDDEMWIFVGDYTDRGIQNGKTLRFLIENFMGKKNVLFLEGNHECHGRNWSNGNIEEVKSKEFKQNTIRDIESENLEMGMIREFYRRIGQVAYYKYNEKVVFVNHACSPNPPSHLTTTEEFIKGVGKYEDVETVQKTWNEKTPENYYQIHGHRNINNSPIRNERCFNLTEKIEEGGFLRVLTLSEDEGWSKYYIKNEVFKIRSVQNEIPSTEASEKNSIIKSLIENKDIVKKKLGDGVVSFSFSKGVFYKKKWNELTSKARGLFVNMNTGNIVARSWEKFFNIEETDDTKYTALKRNMKFPAFAYLKYNGFLGLIGYNQETDSVFVSSKSTNAGDFVEYFMEVIKESDFSLEAAKEICKSKNITLVFEVIHPTKDPHIIEYEYPEMILINTVKNEFEYSALSYEDMINIGNLLNVDVKERAEMFYDWSQFSDWYSDILDNMSHQYNGEYVEGYVIECADGFMFKIKTEYYKFWKKMRGVIDTLSKGRVYNTAWLVDDFSVSIYHKIKNLGRDFLEGKNIIQIRKLIQ